ncbi:hypothetical protein N9022_00620 [bacterium]|nr:hypothetical protein [Akkermansiaceae bacterium]MDB4551639.1 hypothetical protein [bacterium]
MKKAGKIQTLFGSGKKLFGTDGKERSLTGKAYLKQKQNENKKPTLVKEDRLINTCIEQG